MNPERYPLSWPDHQPRATEVRRWQGEAWTVAKVWPTLIAELDRAGFHTFLVSTSVPLQKNGRPYSGDPEDVGAAVWFKRSSAGPWLCIAIDCFSTLGCNLRAIQLIIEGRRREERYGTAAMIESSWSAFEVKALPGGPTWRELLFNPASLEDAEQIYRTLAKTAHPDAGGSDEAMARLNAAIETAREVLK